MNDPSAPGSAETFYRIAGALGVVILFVLGVKLTMLLFPSSAPPVQEDGLEHAMLLKAAPRHEQ